MMCVSRFVRIALVLILLCSFLGLGLVYNRAHARAQKPPTAEWLADNLWEGGTEILAYEVWDGVPRVVYRFGHGSIYYDHMRLDAYSRHWLLPAWQLTGKGYSIKGTAAPASVGIARCAGVVGEACHGPTELFGQVTDPGITGLDVLYQGEWHRFAVATPGFVIRLAGFSGSPDGYRWVNSEQRRTGVREFRIN